MHNRTGFEGLSNIREIIPDVSRLFELLKRVEYQFSREEWTWEQVANRMQQEQQSLCILNTKIDAINLLDALENDPAVLYLSTSLCEHIAEKC